MPTDDLPPVPDPTVLTTQQLLRQVDAERDYADGQIAILKQRLDAMDKATQLLSDTVNRVPTVVQLEIAHMSGLMEEKFGSVDRLMTEKFGSIATQFAERDTRQEREARDNKVAVDAAFAAQKEAAAKQDESNQKAIDKSEKTTAETISKLQESTLTQLGAQSDRITEVKERLDRGEGRDTGGAEQGVATRLNISAALQALAVIITFAGLLIVAFHK